VLILAAGLFTTAFSNVVVEDDTARGVVAVDQRSGEVQVCFQIPDSCEASCFPTTNGKGLMRAGQIEPGDVVRVRFMQDNGKRQKHRGHVTVLK
jgi:hypothetical protein